MFLNLTLTSKIAPTGQKNYSKGDLDGKWGLKIGIDWQLGIRIGDWEYRNSFLYKGQTILLLFVHY